jgi:hypothetical protein
MYYQCLAAFPALYNYFFARRKQKNFLLCTMVSLWVFNAVLCCSIWFATKDETGYLHYDPETGEKNDESEHNHDADDHNKTVLTWYLFGPFWVLVSTPLVFRTHSHPSNDCTPRAVLRHRRRCRVLLRCLEAC